MHIYRKFKLKMNPQKSLNKSKPTMSKIYSPSERVIKTIRKFSTIISNAESLGHLKYRYVWPMYNKYAVVILPTVGRLSPKIARPTVDLPAVIGSNRL